MAELSREDVVRRLKAFREGLSMSRRQFGDVEGITQTGNIVTIHTTQHAIKISADLWEALGRDADKAALELQMKARAN
jgi:hypothetical protein